MDTRTERPPPRICLARAFSHLTFSTHARARTHIHTPVVKVVHEKLNIVKGMITTIHDVTGTQARLAPLLRAFRGLGDGGPTWCSPRFGRLSEGAGENMLKSISLSLSVSLLLSPWAGRVCPACKRQLPFNRVQSKSILR